MTSSDMEKAMAGAWLRFTMHLDRKLPRGLTPEEKDLVGHIFETQDFCGSVTEKSTYYNRLSGLQAKDLINDATSGGTYLVPTFYDRQIISTPLLHSEILPLVSIIEMNTGTQYQSAKIGNVSMTWNTAEGTSLGVFDTTDLINDFSGDVYPVACAVPFGLDLAADAYVADLGGVLEHIVGEKFRQELDRVLVEGDGVTQPEGIFTTAGTTAINIVNAPNGPPTVSDYESLLFGLPKEYRVNGNRVAFVSNDVTYRRSRSIPRSANDAARIFGMDHQSYMLLDTPFKISNDLSNDQAACVAWAYFKLYRRKGFAAKLTTEGRELSLKNEALLIMRGRFGGKISLPAAVAKCTGMQN